MINKFHHFAFIVFALITGRVYVLAQSHTSSNPSTTTGSVAAGVLITYWICNSRKHHAIGGWLLYFYIQLYGGALFSLLIFFTIFQNFNPEIWDDKALYTLYLISTVPSYISILGQVSVASMLLSKRFRNVQTVNWLRIFFVVSFVFSLIGLLIDSTHWPKNASLNFLPLIVSAFWFLYFTFSKRVDLVFKQANWDPKAMYPLSTSAETQVVSKRWLRNYLIVIGIIIFLFLLLIFVFG